MGLHGYLVMKAQCGCCGVVLGSSTRRTAVLRTAAGTIRTLRATASGFVLSVRPPGLFGNPLHYSTIDLCTLFFSLSYRRRRFEIFSPQRRRGRGGFVFLVFDPAAEFYANVVDFLADIFVTVRIH